MRRRKITNSHSRNAATQTIASNKTHRKTICPMSFTSDTTGRDGREEGHAVTPQACGKSERASCPSSLLRCWPRLQPLPVCRQSVLLLPIRLRCSRTGFRQPRQLPERQRFHLKLSKAWSRRYPALETRHPDNMARKIMPPTTSVHPQSARVASWLLGRSVC